ncbi:MAG: hypothetical protein A2096_16300 [Spirochaetes bacterium GWF1_41_5]|nr:MAG: hypothetical protein A2096_16300 [Spirochaetes bacterium GWF1_41_5]HBE04569.1 hypothetical protein [Spirochaetia bacterium]
MNNFSGLLQIYRKFYRTDFIFILIALSRSITAGLCLLVSAVIIIYELVTWQGFTIVLFIKIPAMVSACIFFTVLFIRNFRMLLPCIFTYAIAGDRLLFYRFFQPVKIDRSCIINIHRINYKNSAYIMVYLKRLAVRIKIFLLPEKTDPYKNCFFLSKKIIPDLIITGSRATELICGLEKELGKPLYTLKNH